MNSASEYINSLIQEAVISGRQSITLTGIYEIDSTIILPSEFTLFLEDAHLTMAENTFCNMFRNKNAGTGMTDRNISIVGRGTAVIDGGVYNGLSEKNAGKDGRPHISVNNLLLFAGVDGFRVENIHACNQRWWALNFIHCSHGYIGHIDFLSDYTRIVDGVQIPGLLQNAYGEVYVKNSDGIDLRSGCHDITIENITGFTEDDSVALTGLYGSLEEMYDVPGQSDDIYNVIIRNVNTAAYCGNIRLLNQGGIRLYNILIDGMTDASANCPYMDRGGHGVRVGDNHMYGSRHSTPDETFNITIRNVYSRATYAVSLAGSITNLVTDNICGFDGNQILINNEAVLY